MVEQRWGRGGSGVEEAPGGRVEGVAVNLWPGRLQRRRAGVFSAARLGGRSDALAQGLEGGGG